MPGCGIAFMNLSGKVVAGTPTVLDNTLWGAGTYTGTS